MINLIHHKHDFNLEACWSFSASGHGKGPSDGIGATVKCSSNRSVLTSGTTLSSVKDFFKLTKKINEDAAKLNNSSEPPINVFYLNSSTIDDVTETLISDRFKNLKGNKCNFYRLRITFSSRTNIKYSTISSIWSQRWVYYFMSKNIKLVDCRRVHSPKQKKRWTKRIFTTNPNNKRHFNWSYRNSWTWWQTTIC